MDKKFKVGDLVFVTKFDDDIFNHGFTGVVVGYRSGFICVVDGDEEVWDCYEEQLENSNGN